MSLIFSRTDKSMLGQWWWTVDRSLLAAAMALIAIGVLLSFSASPVVAKRIGAEPYFFVYRHLIYIFPSILLMVFFSMLSVQTMRLICWGGLLVTFILLVLTPFIGKEIKGAVRWIHISFFSLQVTEIFKPFYIVITAWILSKNWFNNIMKTWAFSAFLTVLVVFFVMLQPDFGMSFVICVVWFVQIFVSGLPLLWVLIVALGGLVSVVVIYYLFEHVASRIDRFLGLSQQADLYQIQQSLHSIKNGGFFGVGPGEGHFKMFLPDAHADFIFAVAIEEFGVIMGLIILFLFIFIFTKAFFCYVNDQNMFRQLAMLGIVIQFAVQMIVNISSTLSLIPTKGMTLPFISYGGSSLIGVSIGMGILLCLTRQSRID
ncbi:MAG: cell division protein FtsW [Rickettsiales bacterium]|nr:cell division protein FtsW [Rickettsiales bacterium]|tara:strand:- start:14390 stop:15508 length:1119 start_codon:yes stop_codon:yes gene_type:complete